VFERLLSAGHALLERLQIQLSRFDPQQVSGRAGEQPLPIAVGRQRLTQPRDLQAQRVITGLDGAIAQELGD
jgi:hypothetical protein